MARKMTGGGDLVKAANEAEDRASAIYDLRPVQQEASATPPEVEEPSNEPTPSEIQGDQAQGSPSTPTSLTPNAECDDAVVSDAPASQGVAARPIARQLESIPEGQESITPPDAPDDAVESDAPASQSAAARTIARQLETHLEGHESALMPGRTRAQTRRITGAGSREGDISQSQVCRSESGLCMNCLIRDVFDLSILECEAGLVGTSSDSASNQEQTEPKFPVSADDLDLEPFSYKQAIQSKNQRSWEDAMGKEFTGLKNAGTFEYVDDPGKVNIVGAKWVYKWRKNDEGLVTKAKARLVAKGYSQVEGVDFLETFSPTPLSASVRLLAAVAVENDLDLFHFDAEQAFVQSKLSEDIYMRLPEGCGADSGKVVKLAKSLYGLKQASRSWNELLVKTLLKFGFEQCGTEQCVFRLLNNDGSICFLLAFHVDDIVVAGQKDDIEVLKQALGSVFPIKSFGEVTFYTGCAFNRDRKRGTLQITQTAFVETLLRRFPVEGVRDTPSSSLDLDARREDEPTGNWPYRQVVGSLMWLANMTRPDIANAVRAVARHAHNPSERHWRAVQRILMYLKSHKDWGITFQRGSQTGMCAYADSDYAKREDDRKSISGGAVMFCGAAVSWFSRTQKCVTLSTTEAEYIALGECTRELVYLRGVLEFMQPGISLGTVPIYEDNMGAVNLAKNPVGSSRTKHIDVRHHFLRDLVKKGSIKVVHVDSEYQHADILTKALSKSIFRRHVETLMNV